MIPQELTTWGISYSILFSYLPHNVERDGDVVMVTIKNSNNMFVNITTKIKKSRQTKIITGIPTEEFFCGVLEDFIPEQENSPELRSYINSIKQVLLEDGEFYKD